MSQAQDASGYLRRPFLFAHLIWALLGLAATGLVLVYGGEGHPPGIIFLPVVWVVWALGHGGLWLARRLAVRGRAGAAGREAITPSWPPGLILAAFGAGAATATGVLPLVLTALQWREGRFLEPLWLIMAAIWLAHGVCLMGLLLRRSWSAVYAALLCFGWAALLGAQIVDHLVRRSPIQTGELVIAVTLIVIGALFGWHLMTSRRIRSFLAGGA